MWWGHRNNRTYLDLFAKAALKLLLNSSMIATVGNSDETQVQGKPFNVLFGWALLSTPLSKKMTARRITTTKTRRSRCIFKEDAEALLVNSSSSREHTWHCSTEDSILLLWSLSLQCPIDLGGFCKEWVAWDSLASFTWNKRGAWMKTHTFFFLLYLTNIIVLASLEDNTEELSRWAILTSSWHLLEDL